jgi:hypothetical protein
MTRRFRTRTIPDDLQEVIQGFDAEFAAARPRIQDDPLFWKDSQILCGGIASQSGGTGFYIVLTVLILIGNLTLQNSAMAIVIGCGSICLLPAFLTTRIDGLMGTEFREKTWDDLMLLPIDRRRIVWSKVGASLWQQKAICLPIGMAVACTWPHMSYTVGWMAIISLFTWTVICQLQILGHLTNKWWMMPLSIFVVIWVIVACIEFSVRLTWTAFLLECPIFFSVVTFALQRLIHDQINNWYEQENS